MARPSAGSFVRTARFEGARLHRLRENSQTQIPRRLKPARDDKNKGLPTAHLKVRPFKASCNRLFPQPVQSCRWVRVESRASERVGEPLGSLRDSDLFPT